MRTIIAGGRDYRLTPEDYAFLDSIKHTITEVVCGMARGADMDGWDWAARNLIPRAEFPAYWEIYGKSAGLKRNKDMAIYAIGGQCVLFPGGNGTRDMAHKAKGARLLIHDRRGWIEAPYEIGFAALPESFDKMAKWALEQTKKP